MIVFKAATDTKTKYFRFEADATKWAQRHKMYHVSQVNAIEELNQLEKLLDTSEQIHLNTANELFDLSQSKAIRGH